MGLRQVARQVGVVLVIAAIIAALAVIGAWAHAGSVELDPANQPGLGACYRNCVVQDALP